MLRRMASAALTESDKAVIKKGLSDLQKEAQEASMKEKAVMEEEKKMPWNVNTLSNDGFSKSIINKPAARTNDNLTDEEREKKMKDFINEHKKEIQEFGWLNKFDDSKAFLLERPYLLGM